MLASKQTKILVNATNLVVGGSVQVATSFIVEALKANDAKILWHFCVSSQVAQNLQKLGIDVSTSSFGVFYRNPSHPIKGYKERARLKKVKNDFSPSLVFTVFGPFVLGFAGRSSQPTAHLAGCAVCWSTHPNQLLYDKIGKLQTLKAKLRQCWDFFFLKKASYYWIELDIARDGLKKGVGTDDAHIRTIKNTCAQIFLDAESIPADFSSPEIHLLAMGNPYVHKNFEIVPAVLAELKLQDPSRKYLFTLTAPEDGLAWQQIKSEADSLGVGENIRTIGKVALADCPKLYSENHIVFMPTLLETFSATYPEAMAMRRPIVTTDLNFAHDICGNAAVYYSPLSAKDAAQKIIQVVKDEKLRERLLSEGDKVLSELPTPAEKYRRLVEYMLKIAPSV